MRKCNLNVKELILINPDEVKNVTLQWMFIKETGQLAVRIEKTPNITCTRSETKINVAYRDYEKWM